MLRVMFVDDEPRILEALRRSLELSGCDWNLQFHHDPQEALAAMERVPVDVVVSDLRMPALDGVELLRRVRALHPSTVRVVLSGHADEDIALRAIAVAHRFLPKPCQADALVGLVERLASLVERLHRPALREAVAGAGPLPAVPRLYLKLLEALDNPLSDTSSIAGIVGEEPALATRVLQLCNSALYSNGRPIGDVKGAINRLGLRSVRNLALAAELFRQDAGPAVAALQARSLMASWLALRLLPDRLSAELAGTAALLAGIGTLLPGFADDGPDLPDEAPAYAEAGACLLSLWGLPDALAEAIACHRTPRLGGPQFAVAGAVHVAWMLAGQREVDEGYLAAVGMQPHLRSWRELVTNLKSPDDAA